jgi:hypothetical protein
MEDWIPIGFIALMFLLVSGIFIAVWLAEKKRTAALEQVAGDLSFTFDPEGSAILQSRLDHFELFSQGRSKKLTNLMGGETQDVAISIFDYQYTTGGGKNSTTHKQTVVSIDSASLDLPSFQLRPEHFFHKIGKMFGYQDINFEEFPEFSKQYLLRSDQEAAVREIFSAELTSHLAALAKICSEGRGQEFIFYRAGKRPKPGEIQQLMADAFAVYSLLKMDDQA